MFIDKRVNIKEKVCLQCSNGEQIITTDEIEVNPFHHIDLSIVNLKHVNETFIYANNFQMANVSMVTKQKNMKFEYFKD